MLMCIKTAFQQTTKLGRLHNYKNTLQKLQKYKGKNRKINHY